MKSKKRQLNYRKTQKAGSSNNSTTISRSASARSTIRSVLKSVKNTFTNKHKNGIKQLAKLEDMINQIKTTWRAMEKLNKDQIKTYNTTLKDIAKEQNQPTTNATETNASTTATATATKLDKQRLKIHTEKLQSSLALINQQRLQLNFLRSLTVKFRCLILKYICNKSPSIHPSLFQEYSTILEEIKKIYTKDDLVDMAIIKELYDTYKNSRDEKKIEFFQKLRSIIQIESKELKKLDSLKNTELAKKIVKKCSLDTNTKVRISSLVLRHYEPFDLNKQTESVRTTMSKLPQSVQSTILETITAEPTAKGSKRQPNKKTRKRGKGKGKSKPKPKKVQCNM